MSMFVFGPVFGKKYFQVKLEILKRQVCRPVNSPSSGGIEISLFRAKYFSSLEETFFSLQKLNLPPIFWREISLFRAKSL